jgi:hypothetical protein
MGRVLLSANLFDGPHGGYSFRLVLIPDAGIITHSTVFVNSVLRVFMKLTSSAWCRIIRGMDEIQGMIEELLSRGWTIAALSDELGVSRDSMSRWRAGENPPQNPKLVTMGLEGLLRRRRIPKRKRYRGKRNPPAPKN